MKSRAIPAAALAVAAPACAAEVRWTPLADVRARYEHVAQHDLARDADALTLRVRSGVEAAAGPVSALVEAQGTLAAVGRYYDGLEGAATRPLVADPQNVALHRAQLRYARPGLAVTAGRQRIALDDERFVGAIGFRQNGQSFDAVRTEWSPAPSLKADVSYAWSQRTIWGVDGAGARQQAVSGDNLFANLAWKSPLGTLSGFAYLIDQDEAAVQGFRLSSQSYGARLAGARPLSPAAKLSWQLSYVRQRDWHRNPNCYAADYYLIDARLDVAALKLGAGYEVLGADRGTALTSFQFPLGTNFKFQGWADKFLTTPPDGVRDLYGSAGYAVDTATPLGKITLQAVYHRFDSDRRVRRYGDEIDLLAGARIGRTALSLRFADYRADGFASDTRKLWVQADWAL